MANKFEQKDEVIEKATEYFTKKGYEVRRYIHMEIYKLPDGYEMERPVENPPYDLVISKGDREFTASIKIAIRGTGGAKKPDNWRVTHNAMVTYPFPTIFLVWMPHQERFIELEGTFFRGYRGIRAVPIAKVKAWTKA